jgi:FAD/FMN-containing dehydrogenase
MTDITGVKIVDLTEAGTSEDGEHIWITHRLGDGREYPLIYPYQAVGYLMTALADAARSASRRRTARNPHEAAEGMDSDVIPATEVRVGTAPGKTGVILHFTTADDIPIALELPVSSLGELMAELRRVMDGLGGAPPSRRKGLH